MLNLKILLEILKIMNNLSQNELEKILEVKKELLVVGDIIKIHEYNDSNFSVIVSDLIIKDIKYYNKRKIFICDRIEKPLKKVYAVYDSDLKITEPELTIYYEVFLNMGLR